MLITDEPIEKHVLIDPWTPSESANYPYIGAVKIKGISMHIHVCKRINSSVRKSSQFTVYGIDTEYFLEMDGVGCNSVVFEMPLSKRVINGVSAYHPDYTKLASDYQGLGIMADVYTAVMKLLDINIMSGDVQSPGSVKLWNRLAANRNIEMYSYRPRMGWSPCKTTDSGRVSAKSWFPYAHSDAICVARVKPH